MRHRKAGVKLNRTSSHRDAMFRNMVTSLLKYDRIQTTDTKAKELRRWVDKLITLAKRGDLHARRLAMSIVREKEVVHKLFEEAPKRFGAVQGGYTRIVKIGRRVGDAAPLSLIELVAADAKEKKKKSRKKTKADASQKTKAAAPPADEKAETAALAGKTDAAAAAGSGEPSEEPEKLEEPSAEAENAAEGAEAKETDAVEQSAAEEASAEPQDVKEESVAEEADQAAVDKKEDK